MYSLMTDADIDAATAHTIAAAMREVSRSDGSHPAEEALINSFLEGLPEAGRGVVNLETVQAPEQREAFLKSLLMVALADGDMTDAELAVVRYYAGRLGVSDGDLHELVNEVGGYLLSAFHGVHVFRDDVIALGRSLGVDDAVIERSIDSGDDAGDDAAPTPGVR